MSRIIIIPVIGLLALLGVYVNDKITQEPTEPVSDSVEEVSTSSGGLTGDGVNDFGACDEDADRLCADEVSGTSVTASYKIDLVNCLYENESELTTECKASLDRRKALNEAVSVDCATERTILCTGVTPSPGSEPLMDCLWENESSLSAECLAAVTAHDCAKPLSQVEHCVY